VVSALAEEEAAVEVVSQEAVAGVLLHEGEAVRGADSHGDVVDCLYLGAVSCLCRYLGVFGFVYQVLKLPLPGVAIRN